MRVDLRSGILRRCVAVFTLTAAVTAGSASMAAGTTVLLQQPLESGITNNLFVAHVTSAGMPTGKWGMVLLQPDPWTSNHYLVPTSWNAGAETGFEPTSPSIAQLGFRNQAGTSTAQMEGDTVGAYLNSRDLPTTLTSQLMMLSPQYKWASGSTPVPFSSSTSLLNGELDLQIPVAVGSKTYVTADLTFLGPNGARISYNVNLFHNGATRLFVASNYDSSENFYILNTPLAGVQQFLTQATGSASWTGTPWLGWRHFQWSINNSQFTAALKYLAAKFPGKITSTDPTQYLLSEVHLNAEFHYSPAPAELGWSMRGLKIWITG